MNSICLVARQKGRLDIWGKFMTACASLSNVPTCWSLVRLVSQTIAHCLTTIHHSGGSYRNVFGVNLPDTREDVVFKECVYDDHSFNYEYYEFMRYVLYPLFLCTLPAFILLRRLSHYEKNAIVIIEWMEPLAKL
jgi:hypothetical protein